jgi:protease IV
MLLRAGAALAALLAVAACDPRLHRRPEPDPDDEPRREAEEDGDDEAPPPRPAASPFGMLGALSGAAEPGPYDEPRRSPGAKDGAPYAAILDLRGSVVEIDPPFSFSLEFLAGGGESIALRTITERLSKLARDEKVAAVILRLGDLSLSLAAAEELRAALAALPKPVQCHAETLGNNVVLVTSACARVALAPSGLVELTGPSLVPLYFKGLLDLVGVQADFLHIGAYKGAAEPLTRSEPSKEMRQTYTDIVDGAYRRLVDEIAAGRKVPSEKVVGWIDEGLFPAEAAQARGVVDEVAPFEAFRDAHSPDGAWRRVKWSETEGMDDLMTMLGMRPKKKTRGPHVAVLYAVGEVVHGRGRTGGPFEEIASGKLVPAIYAAAARDDVKAIVLRIDSPGGSALASELVYLAVREAAKKKPVIASMGSVAASGGYYIAAGATKIYAQADTLTGSIGVVGGKLVLGGAMSKLGVTAAEIGRGKRALLGSPLRPWNEDERAALRGFMEATYRTFKSRVAEGRKMEPDAVEKHAQGRVFTGAEAKARGLVDELGGLDAALAAARSLGKLEPDAPIDVYPGEPTLLDLLGGITGARATASLETAFAGPLASLAPLVGAAAAGSARSLVQLALGFEHEPVRVVAFLPVLR